MNAIPIPQPARLLLVEDDRIIAVTLAAGLQAHGYEVRAVESAEAARDLLTRESFDLAILDERLPGISGLDLAQELKNQYRLPFMFLTAYGDDELVSSALGLGALCYLLKPLELQQLLPAVAIALGRAVERRQLNDTAEQLQHALDERREISIAVGILMERFEIERQPAFETLRRVARSQRRKLAELAHDLIAGRTIPGLSGAEAPKRDR